MEKRNFKQIRQEHGISANQLAEAAGVTLGIEYTFEIGGVVPTTTKQSIVAAFSMLTGHDYHLDDFEGPRIAAPPPPVALKLRRKESSHAGKAPRTTHP